MGYEVPTTIGLFIISICAILSLNQNSYAFQIIKGIVLLLSVCILSKLYYSLKDYNSRWRNIQYDFLK